MAIRLQCRAERTSKPNYLVIILACVHLSTCSRRLPSRPSRQPQLANNYTTIVQVFHLIIHILGHTHTHYAACISQTSIFISLPHTLHNHRHHPPIRGEHAHIRYPLYASRIPRSASLTPPVHDYPTTQTMCLTSNYTRGETGCRVHTQTHTCTVPPGSPLLNNNVRTIISYFFWVCVRCARVAWRCGAPGARSSLKLP